jgi:transcriptional regulator with GAF, ATPase, and Fis domain
VITARLGGPISFQLPVSASSPEAARPAEPAVSLRTEEQLREAERANILATLNKTRWKVYGAGGAAELLGIKPGTLAARMKKLGLRRG